MNVLLEPLQYGFFVRGLLAVTLVAALCAVVGLYVVLRGLAYIGDAMAHAVFPGIVGAFLLKLNLFAGAMLAATLTSLGIGAVLSRTKLKQDSAIAIVFVGMFALGVVLLSRARTYSIDLANFLVGNPLGVSSSDLWTVLGVGSLVLLTLAALHKELLLTAFDETEARVIGLPVGLLNNALLLLIALTVVLAIGMVGTVLVVSLLVTSSATARQLSSRFLPTLGLAALFGALSGIIGLYLSYYLAVAPGATVVLVNTAFFVLALLFKGIWSRAKVA